MEEIQCPNFPKPHQSSLQHNSNGFIFNIETNSKNDYETRTKKGNAGIFVKKLEYAPLLIG